MGTSQNLKHASVWLLDLGHRPTCRYMTKFRAQKRHLLLLHPFIYSNPKEKIPAFLKGLEQDKVIYEFKKKIQLFCQPFHLGHHVPSRRFQPRWCVNIIINHSTSLEVFINKIHSAPGNGPQVHLYVAWGGPGGIACQASFWSLEDQNKKLRKTSKKRMLSRLKIIGESRKDLCFSWSSMKRTTFGVRLWRNMLQYHGEENSLLMLQNSKHMDRFTSAAERVSCHSFSGRVPHPTLLISV